MLLSRTATAFGSIAYILCLLLLLAASSFCCYIITLLFTQSHFDIMEVISLLRLSTYVLAYAMFCIYL